MEVHERKIEELILIETGVGGGSSVSPGSEAVRSPAETAAEGSGETLGEMFTAVAHDRGKAPAFTSATATISYEELMERVEGVAAGIANHPSFTVGGRVALLHSNSANYAAAFYGILRAGGIVVPLPPKMETGRLQQIVAATEATLIVTSASLRQSIASRRWKRSAAFGECGRSFQSHDECNRQMRLPDLFPAKRILPTAATASHNVAAIFYTAGSSGEPKGVMLSHENLISNARAIQEYLSITADDRPLCVLPFHHAFGNSVLQSHLLAGANLVVDGQTMFPETIIAALARHECTSLSGVPDLFRMLVERTSLGRTSLPRLRTMAVAGGALERAQALAVAQRIAPARFYVMYGQTEATARLAYIPPDDLDRLPDGALGRPIPGVTLEVVDDNGRLVVPGFVGELRAKGPGVMLGYWRDPNGTAERLRDGWLQTGDLATVDATGAIVLKGRRSALVKIAGHRVHPADLEEFAQRRVAAAQAVAVPYETPGVGTRLALFLRVDAGSSELTGPVALARCRAELPPHLVPEFVQIVESFPLNDALKIDRVRLSQLAENDAPSRRTPA